MLYCDMDIDASEGTWHGGGKKRRDDDVLEDEAY